MIKKHLLPLSILLVFLLSACDPSSLFEARKLGPIKDKGKKELPRWTCTTMLSYTRFVCQADRQVVTVQMAHVVVPYPGDENSLAYIRSKTEASTAKLNSISDEIVDILTNTLVRKPCRLEPEPLPGQSACTSIIFFSSGIDVGSLFVKQGYGMIDTRMTGTPPGIYEEFQMRAIDFSRGIWQSPVKIGDRFNIDFTAFLRRFVERGTYAPLAEDLRRFHSPDLIHAPRYTGDSESESDATIEMEAGAHVTVIATGPPREYDLTIAFRPIVKGNEYSGPIENFKPVDANWTEASFYVRGGQTNTLDVIADPAELSRISHGSMIEVFSGYIIEGYEFKVLSEGKELYITKGEFDPDRTVKELTRSSTGLF